MLFNLIFLTLFVAGWLACALVPWLAVSVATHGRAGLGMLAFCLFSAVVGGLAVPTLGMTGAVGIAVSMAVAFAASGALLAARRFSMHARPTRSAAPPERATMARK